MTGVSNGPIATRQYVMADANNSSSTNLAVGNSYTFTGTSSSTLGVAGIQVSLFADKNCTIRIEQSPNGTNWDLIDTYFYTASGNFGLTVQAVSSYVRVVVTTANETTGTFRLQTALCPIVEAVPRSLDGNGNFKIANPTDEYGFEVENTPTGEMRMVEPFRLIGATFEGATIDANFWTTAATGTAATIAQGNAQLLITSGTGSGATITAFSVRRARYVGGAAMRYRAVVQLDAPTANNTRRWGVGWGSSAMPTVTDGAWFEMNGTALTVTTMKGGTPANVTVFNGHLGTSFAPGTSVVTYEIYWTNSRVWFVVNGHPLHIVSASAATWANTMNFHAFADSVNSAAASSVTMAIRVMTIYRLGKIETAPIWRNVNTTAVTALILKRGPGRLHRVLFNTIPNTTIVSIYDALTATNPICIMNPPNGATPFAMDFSLDFYNGLTITTTPNTADITVVYE